MTELIDLSIFERIGFQTGMFQKNHMGLTMFIMSNYWAISFMEIDEIRQEIIRLSVIFKQYQDLFTQNDEDLEKIKNTPQLMTCFNDLQKLMHYSLFFEALLTDGFKKIDPASHSASLWDLASPIAPLISAFMGFTTKNLGYVFFERFQCKEKEWMGTWAGIDKQLSKSLEENGPSDEAYLGLFEFNLREKTDKNRYDEMIEQLKSSSYTKATAIVDVSDGEFTECLFFIKDEKKLTVLTATNPNNSSSHTHSVTADLIAKHNITHTPKPNIQVIHDGNCSVHSELNINAVLYQALRRNNSVHSVVNDLRQGTLALNNFKVRPTAVISGFKSSQVPDSLTFTRLLSKAAFTFLTLGATGWVDFCKAKQIHPIHIVKTNYTKWAAIKYPLLSANNVPQPVQADEIPKQKATPKTLATKQESVKSNLNQEKPRVSKKPQPAQADEIPEQQAIPKTLATKKVLVKSKLTYQEKLKTSGNLGRCILEQIERLEPHQDSCNPYWMNSRKKVDAIIQAVDNMPSSVNLTQMVNNPKTELHRALNQTRLSPLTCLGVFAWNKTKSLQRVQELAHNEEPHYEI